MLFHYDILHLKTRDGQLELYLHYDYFKIGKPRRDNFKLCNHRLNSPVESKPNGKTDQILTMDAEKVFIKQTYRLPDRLNQPF